MTRTESDTPAAGGAKRQRVAKLMARAGLCSRRDAEAWIVAGRVTLNGTKLTSPAVDVSPDDTVLIDGASLPVAEKTRLFLFHKPRGLVTTDHDPEGRRTVADYLRETWPDGPRVVTIGRLDINTEGLLLLTNDGGLARVLELPQTGWVRRYRVRAKGTADPAALDALSEGVTIDGIDYAGIEAKLDRTQGANTWLTVGLREGKNREIKRVLEHLGLEVNRLIRLSFGPFQLLDLAEGVIEEVRTRVLRDQLGASLAAKAGADFGGVEAPDGPRSIPSPKRSADLTHRRAPGRERRDAIRDEPPQKRERPASGPRKHVSTIRAERARPPTAGPRTRIERSATLDRHDRPVKVERLVLSSPKSSASVTTRKVRWRHEDARPGRPGRERRFDARRDAPERDRAIGDHRERRERGDPSDRHLRASRGGASPSAAGKRERVARSGVRPERGERPDRRDGAPRERSGSPTDMREKHARKDARPSSGARPVRGERSERRADPSPRRPGSSTGALERDTRKDTRTLNGGRPSRWDDAPRVRSRQSASAKHEPFARSGPEPAGERPSGKQKGRAPAGQATRSRPSEPREPVRGRGKSSATHRPGRAKPAARQRRPPDRGDRKRPRGPSRPKR